MVTESDPESWLLRLRDFLMQARLREDAPFADVEWLLDRIDDTLRHTRREDRLRSSEALEESLQEIQGRFPGFLPRDLLSMRNT